MKTLLLLASQDDEARENARSPFFFDVEAVRAVTEAFEEESNKDLAGRVLQAGLRWTGNNSTRTRALKALYKCVGTALVSSEFADYKKAFLFALALCWEYDVGCLDLSDRASEAAFNLAQMLSGEWTENAWADLNVEAKTSSPQEVLTWDTLDEHAPSEHLLVFQGDCNGTRYLNLKELLDKVSKYQYGVPARSP